MSIERFLGILDRTRNGPLCTVKEWEMRVLPGKVSQKLKEHGLRGSFDPENPINTDDALADRFFKAGFELAVDIGFLCQDTERVVKVTEEEIKEAIRNAPSEVAYGRGLDMVVEKHRKPEDKNPPLRWAPLGTPTSDDIWLPLMQAIAENRDIDVFHPSSLTKIFGHPLLAGTPYETLAGRYEAQLVREALWRASRPGMPTFAVASSSTEYGQLGGFGIKGGFDPEQDIAIILSPGELQTRYQILHKVAHSINCGAKIKSSNTSMIGGYSGPPEGVALAQVAAGLILPIIHETTIPAISILDSRYAGTSGREGQWALSMSHQALGRNTPLPRGGRVGQVAGPCTEMLLYESAVEVMNLSASGASHVLFPWSAGGKYVDYLTPLECKFCAEVIKRSSGMTRKEVNEIAKVLIPKYEDRLMEPPLGKSFQECYDLKTLKPTQEWLDIYIKVKRELIDLGVPLEHP